MDIYLSFLCDSHIKMILYLKTNEMKKTLLFLGLLILSGFLCSSYAQITFPYSNGFEDGDPANVANISNAILVDDPLLAHTGDKCYKISGAYAEVDIIDLPFQSGVIYTISFWVKTTDDVEGAFSYLFNWDFSTNVTTNVGTTYQKIEFDYFAEETKSFRLCLSNILFPGDSYLDDISIIQKTEATIPNVVTDTDVKPAPQGELKAILSFKNPAIDIEEEALASLTGVQVEYTKDYNFEKDVQTYTISTSEVGGNVTEEITVPEAGKYYFRMTAFNEGGNSTYAVEYGPSLWIGIDPQVGTPKNLVIEMNNDNTLTLSWDEVTVGYNGGYMGENISYRIKMDNNLEQQTFYTDEVTYTTSELPFNLYVFEVAAIIDGDDSKDSYVKSEITSICGVEENVQLVTNSALVSQMLDRYPFYMNPDVSGSGISQFIFLPEELGGKSYIDSLILFVKTDGLEEPVKQRMMIYLGYKNEEQFTSTLDYTNPADMRLVFNEEIEFSPSERVLTIPIEGFYYDGSKPLLMHFTKPKTGKFEYKIELFGRLGYQRTLFHSAVSHDYEAEWKLPGSSVADYGALIPAMLVHQYNNLAEVSGTVTDKVTNEPIPNAVITINPKTEGEGMYLNTTIQTGENGEYIFDYLPVNTFNIGVEAPNYIGEVKELVVEADGVYTLDFSLAFDGVSIKTTSDNKAVLFPNPSIDGRFKLQSDYDCVATVLTTSGVQIVQKKLVAGMNDINLSECGSGIYFIHITDSTGVKMIKAVIK